MDWPPRDALVECVDCGRWVQVVGAQVICGLGLVEVHCGECTTGPGEPESLGEAT